jgi:hypothetical protein
VKYSEKDFDIFWKKIQKRSGLDYRPYQTTYFVFAYDRYSDTVMFVTDLNIGSFTLGKITKKYFQKIWKCMGSSVRVPRDDKILWKFYKFRSKKDICTALILESIIPW